MSIAEEPGRGEEIAGKGMPPKREVPGGAARWAGGENLPDCHGRKAVERYSLKPVWFTRKGETGSDSVVAFFFFPERAIPSGTDEIRERK